jgi:16S rRNA processing protein RimM
LGSGEADGPDADLPPLAVEAARPFKKGYLVRFAGVTDRFQAEDLRGHYLFREAEALEPLAEGELFYHQLLGMEVLTTDGVRLGEVTEVYESLPGDLLQVQGEERQLMIPFLKHIVVEVDAETGRMVIDPPDGLLDL